METGAAISPGDSVLFAQEPCAALRPFVARYLVVGYGVAHSDLHLPGTGLILAFRLHGGCLLYGESRAPDVALTGLWQTARRHEHGAGHVVAIVQFTPIGAAAVLRQPVDAFADSTVALTDALGRAAQVEYLHEQLVAARNYGQRIRLLEGFLLDRIGHAQPDSLITAAVVWLEQASGSGRIDGLARYIGLSESALERRFRRYVGTSPRKFASLVRLRRVVRLRDDGADFTTIAHAAGYFDQSHFIKDFRRFSGVAPSVYFGRDGS